MVTFKKDFPLLTTHPELIFLDNASTTQKPQHVIDAVSNFVSQDYANIHRGSYDLAVRSEKLYHQSKTRIGKVLNCSADEIIYGYNATACANLLAQSLCLSGILGEGDEVLLGIWDHHANIVPWQQLQKVFKFSIQFIGITSDYSIDRDDFAIKYTAKTKVVACGYVSNVTGYIYDIPKLSSLLRDDTFFAIDASQAIPHFAVDVQEIWCDALYFTAHKIFAYTGLGIMYLAKDHIRSLQPMMSGGGSIADVTTQGNELLRTVEKFEPGTPNIIGAVSMGAALEYLDWIGGYRTLHEVQEPIIEAICQGFRDLWDKVVLIWSQDSTHRIGVFSFAVPGKNTLDVADALADRQICVRAWGHCAHPFLYTIDQKSLVRISISLYNDLHDIERFFAVLREII